MFLLPIEIKNKIYDRKSNKIKSYYYHHDLDLMLGGLKIGDIKMLRYLLITWVLKIKIQDVNLENTIYYL